MARILIAEDDALLAHLLASMLSLDGHDVETVDDGPRAIARATGEARDLLLLDVNLPGSDGFEICRRVRESEDAEKRATIVMITGRHDTAGKLLAFSMGADDYLVKPVDTQELRSRVMRWIESRTEHADLVSKRRRDAIAEIVAAICHELNNPLSAAMIGVELTLQRESLSGESRRDLELVRCNLDRMDDVLKALTGVRDSVTSYVGDAKMIDIRKTQG
jgi:DNA-binding response OmpR family regulator